MLVLGFLSGTDAARVVGGAVGAAAEGGRAEGRRVPAGLGEEELPGEPEGPEGRDVGSGAPELGAGVGARGSPD